MKRLIVVCEGRTEHEFCNSILAPYLLEKGIVVSAPLIKKSNGGIVWWNTLKDQIVRHLKEKDVYVTMLIDYYGIKELFGYPGWSELLSMNEHERIPYLVEMMKKDLDDCISHHFIPYMQIHEFEGLLFCDIEAFKSNFSEDEADFREIESVMNEFDSPEDINDSPETAPSKRLVKAIPGYDKVLYGICIALDIGLETIRAKCPLFNEWLTKLEAI